MHAVLSGAVPLSEYLTDEERVRARFLTDYLDGQMREAVRLWDSAAPRAGMPHGACGAGPRPGRTGRPAGAGSGRPAARFLAHRSGGGRGDPAMAAGPRGGGRRLDRDHAPRPAQRPLGVQPLIVALLGCDGRGRGQEPIAGSGAAGRARTALRGGPAARQAVLDVVPGRAAAGAGGNRPQPSAFRAQRALEGIAIGEAGGSLCHARRLAGRTGPGGSRLVSAARAISRNATERFVPLRAVRGSIRIT